MSSDPMQRVPYAVSPPRYSVAHQMVTTAFELPNYRIVQNLGVVRGIVVRSFSASSGMIARAIAESIKAAIAPPCTTPWFCLSSGRTSIDNTACPGSTESS